MPAHSVFLSYTQQDQEAASRVCSLLEADGIGCWLASRDAVESEDKAAASIEAIRSSDLVLLIFSASANSSPYVLREIERAISYERPVLSIHLDDAVPNPSLEYYLNLWQWLEAPDGVEHRREEIVAAVHRQLAGSPDRGNAPEPDPPAPLDAEEGPEAGRREEAVSPHERRRKARIVAFALAVVAVAVGLGLGLGLGLTSDHATWAKLAPLGTLPSVRFGHSVAYDSNDGLVIVFGGQSPSAYLSDTWAYDPAASVWTERHPSGSIPSERVFQATAYDSDSKRVVLFGGLSYPNTSSVLDDTWIYEPAADTWTELHPIGPVPSARAGHTMAYDPITKRVILFGGAPDISGTEGSLDSTWAYEPSKNTWTELKPSGPVPAARQGHVMAYYSAEGLMTVFGGAAAPRDLNDLWAYDPSANTWIELKPSGPSPKGRNGAALCYDPLVDRLVLFGGFNGGSAAATGYVGDTWEYDFAKNKWTEIESNRQAPVPRQFSSLVFCPTVRRAILFGGVSSKAFLNDAWAFGR